MDCVSGFVCLWLSIGFSQRKTPRGKESDVRVMTPPHPLSARPCWLHLSTEGTTPVRWPSPYSHPCWGLLCPFSHKVVITTSPSLLLAVMG